MKVQHYKAVEPIRVDEIERATAGVTIRRLISEVDGAGSYTLDIFEVQPGGYSAFHTHAWEPHGYVIRGRGALVGPAGETPPREGDVLYIPPEEPHQFRNTGDEPLEMICLLPQAALTAYYMERIGSDAPPDPGAA